MANENRFSNLMGGINQTDSSKPPAAKAKATDQASQLLRKPRKNQHQRSQKKAKYDDKENYKQVGMYLPVELHRRVKIGAAMTGKEMSEIMAEGVELWLKKNTPNI